MHVHLSRSGSCQASTSIPFAAAVSRIVVKRLHTRPICSSHCIRPSASVSKRSSPSTWSIDPCKHDKGACRLLHIRRTSIPYDCRKQSLTAADGSAYVSFQGPIISCRLPAQLDRDVKRHPHTSTTPSGALERSCSRPHSQPAQQTCPHTSTTPSGALQQSCGRPRSQPAQRTRPAAAPAPRSRYCCTGARPPPGCAPPQPSPALSCRRLSLLSGAASALVRRTLPAKVRTPVNREHSAIADVLVFGCSVVQGVCDRLNGSTGQGQ